jgi:hypothetical protein
MKAPTKGRHDLEDGHMEPLNLLVSLSHFGDAKPTLPPKQPKRRKTATPNAPEQREATGARGAFRRIRTAVAR